MLYFPRLRQPKMTNYFRSTLYILFNFFVHLLIVAVAVVVHRGHIAEQLVGAFGVAAGGQLRQCLSVVAFDRASSLEVHSQVVEQIQIGGMLQGEAGALLRQQRLRRRHQRSRLGGRLMRRRWAGADTRGGGRGRRRRRWCGHGRGRVGLRERCVC